MESIIVVIPVLELSRKRKKIRGGQRADE